MGKREIGKILFNIAIESGEIIHILFFDWSIQVSKPETVIEVINDFVRNAVDEKP
jgi:hypothetical protein